MRPRFSGWRFKVKIVAHGTHGKRAEKGRKAKAKNLCLRRRSDSVDIKKATLCRQALEILPLAEGITAFEFLSLIFFRTFSVCSVGNAFGFMGVRDR